MSEGVAVFLRLSLAFGPRSLAEGWRQPVEDHVEKMKTLTLQIFNTFELFEELMM